MESLLPDIGITIEIVGFVLMLIFWKIPTYHMLRNWKIFQTWRKFLGKKKYQEL